MARIDNLNHFLTDVATAIKNKAGLTEITPANFDTAINNISTGLEIQGLLKDYYVAAGKNINPGTFIEFVQGTASVAQGTTPYNSLIPTVEGNANASYISGDSHRTAQLSDNVVLLVTNMGRYSYSCHVAAIGLIFQNSTVITTNTVFLAEGQSNDLAVIRRDDTMGVAIVNGKAIHLKLVGQTLTAVSWDEDKLSGGSYCYFQRLSTPQNCIVVDGDHVYVVGRGNEDGSYEKYVGLESYIYSDYYGAPYLDSIDDDRTSAFYDTAGTLSFNITGLVQANTNTFIIFGQSFTTDCLYAVAATVDSAYTPTFGTLYTLSSDANFLTSTAQNMFCFFNKGVSKGFYFRAYHNGYDSTDEYTLYNLKGFLLTVSGTTISSSLQTVISTTEYEEFEDLNGTILADGKCFLYWADEYEIAKRGFIATVSSGFGLSKGSIYQLAPTDSNDDYEASCPLQTGKSLLFSQPNMTGASSGILQGKEWFYSGTVLSDTGSIAVTETQVQPATTTKVDGIAKTGGVGGTSTAHNQQISIYVPNV